jgi:adenosylcobinamide kinase/adenosylcobinamide-phosphate guanylyltransferase
VTPEFFGCELILGGQKSGKSRHAEQRAQDWLQCDDDHRAVVVATALPGDAEMQARIARHRHDRDAWVQQQAVGHRLQTLEVPYDLAHAIAHITQPQVLVLVDCLTLWLTNWLMPASPDAGAAKAYLAGYPAAEAALLTALESAQGPLVLVSHDIGAGVVPLGAEVRQFVDAQGLLNQRVAALSQRVSLMVAGLALQIKGGA